MAREFTPRQEKAIKTLSFVSDISEEEIESYVYRTDKDFIGLSMDKETFDKNFEDIAEDGQFNVKFALVFGVKVEFVIQNG